MNLVKFKVVIHGYTRGRHPQPITTHVSSISWDDKVEPGKPYWVKRLGTAGVLNGKPIVPPVLLSKVAAEAVAPQVARWQLRGPGPNGLAVVTIEPVMVSQ